MNLYRLLQARMNNNKPIRIGLIGAGKFGTMFLSQAGRTPGLHILAIADLDTVQAKKNLAKTGWPVEKYNAGFFEFASIQVQ